MNEKKEWNDDFFSLKHNNEIKRLLNDYSFGYT